MQATSSQERHQLLQYIHSGRICFQNWKAPREEWLQRALYKREQQLCKHILEMLKDDWSVTRCPSGKVSPLRKVKEWDRLAERPSRKRVADAAELERRSKTYFLKKTERATHQIPTDSQSSERQTPSLTLKNLEMTRCGFGSSIA